jgi:KaiC/GvpD/RAD55 family RecA-like ATPase
MGGRDANDVLREEGIEGVRAMMDGAKPFKPAKKEATLRSSNGAKAKPPRFPYIHIDDVKKDLDGASLISGLLPTRGLVVVYGVPGCGKSFLVLHAVLHVAGGLSYVGRRVEKSHVLYIAAEGQDRFGNRIVAAREQLKLPTNTLFGLIKAAPNLGKLEGDTDELIAEIRAQTMDYDEVAVIVIDTLSRTMYGASESSDEGMGVFVANAGKIAEELDCLVIAIHHKGKDESRGMRGWSGLHGATDAEWEVTEEGGKHTVTIRKMKDGSDGLSWHFSLEQIPLGKNKNGEPVTTCIVEIDGEVRRKPPSIKKTATQRKSKAHRTFDAALNEATIDGGDTFFVGNDRSAAVKAVRRDQIRPYFDKLYPIGRPCQTDEDKRRRDQAVSGAFCKFVQDLPAEYGHEVRDGFEHYWRV